MLDNSPYIIAEVAQAHDGNLNIAHSFIDAVSKTGVNAIKFQTHYAEEETTKSEPWRKKFSWIDDSRYDYWQRIEFSREEWITLSQHSRDVGLDFLSSPFSIKANNILYDCNMKYWKIASGELTNYPLIDDICSKDGKFIISCGLSEEAEIQQVVERIKNRGCDIISIMECTSKYPTPLEEINLSRMVARGNLLNLSYGLSDHSADLLPGISSMLLGANVIEVHVTMHQDSFGPDTPASLTLSQLKELAIYREKIIKLLQPAIDDNVSKQKMKKIFRKSIYAANDISTKETFSLTNLAFKKPSNSISAELYESIIGKKPKRSIKSGEPLNWEDIL